MATDIGNTKFLKIFVIHVSVFCWSLIDCWLHNPIGFQHLVPDWLGLESLINARFKVHIWINLSKFECLLVVSSFIFFWIRGDRQSISFYKCVPVQHKAEKVFTALYQTFVKRFLSFCPLQLSFLIWKKNRPKIFQIFLYNVTL